MPHLALVPSPERPPRPLPDPDVQRGDGDDDGAGSVATVDYPPAPDDLSSTAVDGEDVDADAGGEKEDEGREKEDGEDDRPSTQVFPPTGGGDTDEEDVGGDGAEEDTAPPRDGDGFSSVCAVGSDDGEDEADGDERRRSAPPSHLGVNPSAAAGEDGDRSDDDQSLPFALAPPPALFQSSPRSASRHPSSDTSGLTSLCAFRSLRSMPRSSSSSGAAAALARIWSDLAELYCRDVVLISAPPPAAAGETPEFARDGAGDGSCARRRRRAVRRREGQLKYCLERFKPVSTTDGNEGDVAWKGRLYSRLCLARLSSSVCGRTVERVGQHDAGLFMSPGKRAGDGYDEQHHSLLLDGLEDAMGLKLRGEGGEGESLSAASPVRQRQVSFERFEDEEDGPYLAELTADEWRTLEKYLHDAREAMLRPDADELVVPPLRTGNESEENEASLPPDGSNEKGGRNGPSEAHQSEGDARSVLEVGSSDDDNDGSGIGADRWAARASLLRHQRQRISEEGLAKTSSHSASDSEGKYETDTSETAAPRGRQRPRARKRDPKGKSPVGARATDGDGEGVGSASAISTATPASAEEDSPSGDLRDGSATGVSVSEGRKEPVPPPPPPRQDVLERIAPDYVRLRRHLRLQSAFAAFHSDLREALDEAETAPAPGGGGGGGAKAPSQFQVAEGKVRSVLTGFVAAMDDLDKNENDDDDDLDDESLSPPHLSIACLAFVNRMREKCRDISSRRRRAYGQTKTKDTLRKMMRDCGNSLRESDKIRTDLVRTLTEEVGAAMGRWDGVLDGEPTLTGLGYPRRRQSSPSGPDAAAARAAAQAADAPAPEGSGDITTEEGASATTNPGAVAGSSNPPCVSPARATSETEGREIVHQWYSDDWRSTVEFFRRGADEANSDGDGNGETDEGLDTQPPPPQSPAVSSPQQDDLDVDVDETDIGEGVATQPPPSQSPSMSPDRQENFDDNGALIDKETATQQFPSTSPAASLSTRENTDENDEPVASTTSGNGSAEKTAPVMAPQESERYRHRGFRRRKRRRKSRWLRAEYEDDDPADREPPRGRRRSREDEEEDSDARSYARDGDYFEEEERGVSSKRHRRVPQEAASVPTLSSSPEREFDTDVSVGYAATQQHRRLRRTVVVPSRCAPTAARVPNPGAADPPAAASASQTPHVRRRRKMFTDAEKVAILAGVAKWGVGKWAKMKADPRFADELRERTPVQIKDSYRTMWKRGEARGPR